jgi:hypothetical protein
MMPDAMSLRAWASSFVDHQYAARPTSAIGSTIAKIRAGDDVDRAAPGLFESASLIKNSSASVGITEYEINQIRIRSAYQHSILGD